jgi:hypothetical protein
MVKSLTEELSSYMRYGTEDSPYGQRNLFWKMVSKIK